MTAVNGSNISYINGTATGPVTWFLVNPNGIIIGDSARINVNNFVASTLSISANNFINGNYILQHNPGSPYGYILNEGRITASNIALIASAVNNSGVLIAKAGTVNLASGDKVTVSFDMRGLMQVVVNKETSGYVYDAEGNKLKDAIKNSGRIEATQVVMTVRTALALLAYCCCKLASSSSPESCAMPFENQHPRHHRTPRKMVVEEVFAQRHALGPLRVPAHFPLADAIDREDYESAAQLRDILKDMDQEN